MLQCAYVRVALCILAVAVIGCCKVTSEKSQSDGCEAEPALDSRELTLHLVQASVKLINYAAHQQASHRREPLQTLQPDGANVSSLRRQGQTGIKDFAADTLSGDRKRAQIQSYEQGQRSGDGLQSETQPPSGSDIWNSEETWVKVSEWHPAGVISNLGPAHAVRWNDVSYISITVIACLCAVAYPASLVLSLLVLTVLVGMCLKVDDKQDGSQQSADASRSADSQGEPQPPGVQQGVKTPGVQDSDVLQRYLKEMPVLPKHSLTPTSRTIYACWALFCCSVPCLMVFGTPVFMVALARPYPQEVLAALTLLTSAFIFSNSLYMALFASRGLIEISLAQKVDYSALLPREQEPQVLHWIILPMYKEELEVVSMALRSVAGSSIAKSSIGVVLAMEEREQEAPGKAEVLMRSFQGQFREMIAVYHPAGLPNDPPGKASNLRYAFKELLRHIGPSEEVASKVVLTVADADSEFCEGYFESLSSQFLASSGGSRYLKFWQSPVFHLKNYHRQPSPVIVGTMFTSMQELAALSDPHAVRFPYSTYSLSLKLAGLVGGWDAEWIAEDNHMGIKCYLMTLGRSTVEPLMLPTVNYVPEEMGNWWGTCYARWIQLKRHALGFSDFSYYFMMLPLVFSYSTGSVRRGKGMDGLTGFWRMLTYGTTLIVRLVNVHVLIGVLSTYGVLEAALKLTMKIWIGEDRWVEFLFLNVGQLPTFLIAASVVCTVLCSILFLKAYYHLENRIEGTSSIKSPVLHWMKNLIGLALSSPFYFVFMGYAIWSAAVHCLTQSSFEYQVAPKPMQKPDACEERETGTLPGSAGTSTPARQ